MNEPSLQLRAGSVGLRSCVPMALLPARWSAGWPSSGEALADRVRSGRPPKIVPSAYSALVAQVGSWTDVDGVSQPVPMGLRRVSARAMFQMYQ